jgi:hypothetical protein
MNKTAKATKSIFFIRVLRRQKCAFPSQFDAIISFLIVEEMVDAPR